MKFISIFGVAFKLQAFEKFAKRRCRMQQTTLQQQQQQKNWVSRVRLTSKNMASHTSKLKAPAKAKEALR